MTICLEKPLRVVGAALILLAAVCVGSASQDRQAGKSAVLFDSAASHARDGEVASALRDLSECFDAGYPTPSDVLSNPDFRSILENPSTRERLRQLLRDHAVESRVTMVGPDEPGDPLTVRGTLLDGESGLSVKGALIYLYHTDMTGAYSPESPRTAQSSSNPRLFAYIRPDRNGEFELVTILPASYPGTRMPRHVHYEITAPGYPRVVREFIFDLDPEPTPAQRRWAAKNEFPIVMVEEGEDGSLECEVVLLMRRR